MYFVLVPDFLLIRDDFGTQNEETKSVTRISSIGKTKSSVREPISSIYNSYKIHSGSRICFYIKRRISGTKMKILSVGTRMLGVVKSA